MCIEDADIVVLAEKKTWTKNGGIRKSGRKQKNTNSTLVFI